MVWLTFFGSLAGAAGVLFGFYALVLGVLSLRARAAKPKFGISSTGKDGELAYWFTWDPAVYAIEAYRFTVNVLNPNGVEKEQRFTVTMDPVQKKPFWQPVQLPDSFKELIASNLKSREALITLSLRTTDELCLHKTFYIGKFRDLLKRKPTKVSGTTALEVATIDEPSVSSLDYSELTVRKETLKKLASQAKAKAASAKKAADAKKAAAAPAAAPAAADKKEAAGVAQGKA